MVSYRVLIFFWSRCERTIPIKRNWRHRLPSMAHSRGANVWMTVFFLFCFSIFLLVCLMQPTNFFYLCDLIRTRHILWHSAASALSARYSVSGILVGESTWRQFPLRPPHPRNSFLLVFFHDNELKPRTLQQNVIQRRAWWTHAFIAPRVRDELVLFCVITWKEEGGQKALQVCEDRSTAFREGFFTDPQKKKKLDGKRIWLHWEIAEPHKLFWIIMRMYGEKLFYPCEGP